jgi:RNA polymerase sigma factor (sigma-70 family)
LVERHGPVVLRVCRDILGNPAYAEDAFQATFLVLVRRARSIRNRESVASWLYGVALRVAGCARSSASRRRERERKAASRMDGIIEEGADDLGPVLHDEVGRLPEKYRAVVVLCYLESLTHEQAAERLHCPVGTVRSRLSWARQRLRARLTRRGLAPAVALAAVELSHSALAVPPALVECTAHGGLQLAAGQAPSMVSAAAVMLTEGVIRTMMLAKWKMIAMVVMTIGITTVGAGGLMLAEGDEPQTGVTTKAKGETSKVVAPGRASPQEKQIKKLMAYSDELTASITEKQKEWLQWAQNGAVDLDPPSAVPQPVSFAQYRHVRDQLFAVNMQLIETEALAEERQAEIETRSSGVDPEIRSLLKEMEQLEHKIDIAAERMRLRSDPKLSHERRPFEKMKEDVHDLIEKWKEGLTAGFPKRGEDNATLQELEAQINSMKAKKSAYEKILTQLKQLNEREGADAVKQALVREDLASFRQMRSSIEKRIEQLKYDASAARRQ